MLPQLGLPQMGFAAFPGLAPPQQERQALIPPLDPATEQTLLARIGGSTLSGLASVGHFLDTPGSVVRGMIAGDPMRALSGIADPSQRVYGVDLLGQPHDTSLFSGEGVAGLATEIALDPLTYLTFGAGALTRLGKSAKMAGVLPKTTSGRIQGLAEGSQGLEQLARHVHDVPIGPLPAEQLSSLANQPLGSVANWLGMPLGSGEGGLRFLDTIGAPFRAISKVEPIDRLRRGAVAMFDPAVRGTTSREVQPFARQASEAYDKAIPAEMRKLVGLTREMQEAGVLDRSHLLRPIAEQIDPAHYTEEVKRLLSELEPDAAKVVHNVGGEMRSIDDALLQAQLNLGGNIAELKDNFAAHLARHINVPSKSSKGIDAGTRALGTFHPEMLSREETYRNIPGGSAAIEEIMGNPALAKLAPKDAAAAIREQYLWQGIPGMSGMDDAARMAHADSLRAGLMSDDGFRQLEREISNLEGGLAQVDFPLSPTRRTQVEQQLQQARQAFDHESGLRAELSSIEGVATKSKGLAGKLGGLDPRLADEGRRFFRDPISDMANYINHSTQSIKNMESMHDLFVQYARAADDVGEVFAPRGFVNLDQAYSMVNMGRMSESGFGKANPQALAQFAERSAKAGKTGDMIPRHIAEDAARMVKAIQAPESLEPFLKLFDQATNLFKAGNTFIWPAYHIRNLFSSLSQNMFTGNFSVASIRAARDLHFGNIINEAVSFPALKGMTAEAATKAIADTGVAHGLLAKDFGPNADVVGRTVSDIMGGQQISQLPGPGVRQAGVGEVLGRGISQTGQDLWKSLTGATPEIRSAARTGANPLNIAGVAANRDMWAPAVAGRQIASQIDELGTMSAFIEMLRKGYTLDAAAQQAKAIHYRGARFTGFEQGVMRRMVPFYWWMRNNTEFITRQVFERPGGAYAQAFRAGTRARGSEEGFMPPWLGQNVVAPIGEEVNGTQKFIGSLGLPFEDVPSLMSVAGAAGTLNPLVKAPLELMTGKQFFSGRDLADLQPYTGSTVADQILFNSPLARVARYGRQAMDDRKTPLDQAVNFLTGVRVTDVDMAKARDIAVRDYVTDSLRGRPNIRQFENPYVRREDLPNISPQDMLLLQLQASRRQAYQQRQRT